MKFEIQMKSIHKKCSQFTTDDQKTNMEMWSAFGVGWPDGQPDGQTDLHWRPQGIRHLTVFTAAF